MWIYTIEPSERLINLNTNTQIILFNEIIEVSHLTEETFTWYKISFIPNPENIENRIDIGKYENYLDRDAAFQMIRERLTKNEDVISLY